MKKGLFIIAGGLLTSAALFSCQGGGNDAQTQKTIDSLQQRQTFVADSINLACQTKSDSLTAYYQAVIDSLNTPASSSKGSTTKPKGSTTTKTTPANNDPNQGKKGTGDATNTGKKGSEAGKTDQPLNTGKKKNP
jgi:hypothetical protein